MKKRITILSVVIAIVVGASLFFTQHKKKRPSRKEVVISRKDLVVTTQATGVIEPENKVQILPPTAGRIDEIMVEEGTTVAAGQRIAEMSSTNRAALFDIAKTKTNADRELLKDSYLPVVVFSPVAGRIVNKFIVPGQTVTQSTVLFELSDRLIVRAQVDETDVGSIALGMEAIVTVDAFPEKKYPGKVGRIAQQSKLVNNVNVYPVELTLEEAPELRSGMTANVNFIVTKKSGVLAVPMWATGISEERVLRGQDESGFPVEFKLGVSDGKYVEVLDGIENTTFFIEDVKLPDDSDAVRSPFSPMRPQKKKK